MPGEFLSQADAARAAARRSDAQRQPGLAAKRGPRAKQQLQGGTLSENYHCTGENSQIPAGTNCRRSPRLSGLSAANSNRSFGSMRSGVMSDITNVTAGRASQVDKTKQLKLTQQSFQPPTVVRDVPAVALAAPAVDMSLEEKVVVTMSNDPQRVTEYVPDIICHLYNSESLCLPRADYMNIQTDITGKMRMILMDWLVEVHMKYRLTPETLHLTVNLIDRYLSKKQITRRRLQLVGVAAMFIASKFEEINPPELHDWVYITDNAYSKEDVLTMECNMLSILNFQIAVPTAAHFFEHLVDANGCDAAHRSCAQYLLELGLLDSRMLEYKPSHMVAAALLLSNELFVRSHFWPDAMAQQSRYSEQALRHCTEELRQLWKADRAGAGGQLQAVHKKFSTPQRHSVATMNFRELL